MSTTIEIPGVARQHVGKGASRRLRRQGMVPAVLYGGTQAPENLAFEHRIIIKQLENEAFYSQVITVNLGDRQEQVVLRDLQRHPFKPMVLHMDLQRISADEQIRVVVPLHFMNQEIAHGVRQEGGMVNHLLSSVEVSCLPGSIPEFIEVDITELHLGQSIHLSELKLPEGVQLTQSTSGDHDEAVVSIVHRGGAGGGGSEEEYDEDDALD